jgi:GYF domain 2
MQQHQLSAAAAQAASSWYLARGDKQYGPLGNRELLLLAQRGELKQGDLLWRPGLSSWKPAREIADLVRAAASAAGTDRTGAAASRLSKSTGAAPAAAAAREEPAPPKRSLKVRLLEELRKFFVIVAYLWLVFFVLFVHEWLVLAGHNIGFRFYGLATLNALVLGKIMLIAENMRFTKRFDNRPLIVPIAYKSIVFAVLLLVAYIAEEIGVGMFHGKTAAESFPVIGGGGPAALLCVTAIMAAALVPFFAFREIARVVGEAEFRVLMLGAPREKRVDAREDAPPLAAATGAA